MTLNHWMKELHARFENRLVVTTGDQSESLMTNLTDFLRILTSESNLAWASAIAVAAVASIHGMALVIRLQGRKPPSVLIDLIVCVSYGLLTWVYATHALQLHLAYAT